MIRRPLRPWIATDDSGWSLRNFEMVVRSIARAARSSAAVRQDVRSARRAPPKRHRRHPGGTDRSRARLLLGVRQEDQVTHEILRIGVHDRPQEREAPAFAVHGVLARGERHGAPAVLALPNGEADELEAGERAVDEVEFGVCELPRGLPLSFGVIVTEMFCIVPVACRLLASLWDPRDCGFLRSR
jgi:hypothetical protein